MRTRARMHTRTRTHGESQAITAAAAPRAARAAARPSPAHTKQHASSSCVVQRSRRNATPTGIRKKATRAIDTRGGRPRAHTLTRMHARAHAGYPGPEGGLAWLFTQARCTPGTRGSSSATKPPPDEAPSASSGSAPQPSRAINVRSARATRGASSLDQQRLKSRSAPRRGGVEEGGRDVPPPRGHPCVCVPPTAAPTHARRTGGRGSGEAADTPDEDAATTTHARANASRTMRFSSGSPMHACMTRGVPPVRPTTTAGLP